MKKRYRLKAVFLIAAMLLPGTTVVAQSSSGVRIRGSVYGGGALANTGGNTEVNLHSGTIEESVYGGGLGQLGVEAQEAQGTEGEPGYKPPVVAVEDVAALVNGDVTVKLNETTATDNCVIKGSIFGCNNKNGTPKGNVTVHIYKTQGYEGHDRTEAKNDDKVPKGTGIYELAAVYGGGNEAAYEPTNQNGTTEVIIDGCSLTSIEYVYGGGNAASAPATHILVNSCYEIGTLFAGGNGAGEGNPGANVGYKAFTIPAEATADDITTIKNEASYGLGTTLAELYGGTIHKAYGGSNTKGNIRESATVKLDNQDDTCPLCVDEVYGAGNEADQDGSSEIQLGCVEYLEEIYGGARNADVNKDVVLNIQSGRFHRVFGGNNLGGRINGTITVNIEETGCHPIIIGQLYGGGNQAAYTAPTGEHGPTVNVKSFTSIGEIYGGGYGASAVVNGDTYVYIDECVGENANAEMKKKVDENTGIETSEDSNVSAYTDIDVTINEGEDDEVTIHQPEHKAGEIGAIGNVFGGGNAANVIGNTNVKIGTLTTITYESIDDNPATEDTNESERSVTGVDIRGNVYGGGNNAEVTGNTNVEIGKRSE